MKLSLIDLKTKNKNVLYWCVVKEKHKIKHILGFITKNKKFFINFNLLQYYINNGLLVTDRFRFYLKNFYFC